MKPLFFYLLASLFLFNSCGSLRTAADYDKTVDFSTYNSFAFFKTGIDKAEINGLDKRRILRAIEKELLAKGFTKSETPNLLVSFFTKERQQVNVYNNNFNSFGFGWGWSPFYWNQNYQVSNTSRGTLYIDLIDAKTKELVWQGVGNGYLTNSISKKEERINAFVNAILKAYPPEQP